MIEQAFCNAAKAAFLDGVHQPDDEYRLALYAASAKIDADTVAYTPDGEVRGQGYSAGGKQVTRGATGLMGSAAWLDFGGARWDGATITARAALLYNNTAPGKPAIAVLDFGQDYSATNGRFDVKMPAPGPHTAVVRSI